MAKKGRIPDAKRITRLLQSEGGWVPRRTVLETLGLTETRYEEVVAELIQDGTVRKKQTRGGGLELLVELEPEEAETTQPLERDLYDPFAKYLREAAGEENSRSTVIDTSRAKLRKWETPDIIEVKLTPYPSIGQWELQLRTFELKREETWNVDSVLQTAAYAEFAHECWLVVPAGNDLDDWVDYFTARVVTKATDFGVGLATFDRSTATFKKHMHAQTKRVPSMARQHEWMETMLEKLADPKLKRSIADNIRWARSQAEAGRG